MKKMGRIRGREIDFCSDKADNLTAMSESPSAVLPSDSAYALVVIYKYEDEVPLLRLKQTSDAGHSPRVVN
jgi:hypothetical protein